MIRLRLIALAACLALAGCGDARRDAARRYVHANSPAGFELVAAPEAIPITSTAAGASEAVVTVRYRLLQPTIEIRDGFALPRGIELSRQLTSLRGWALGTLPAGDLLRDEILGAVARARAAFPVKRIVTPAGTEVDALVSFTLQMEDGDWKATKFQTDARVPGAPDKDPAIPSEGAPAVAARLEQLAENVRQLAETRREYLAARKRADAESLARLRAEFRTGRTFTGRLPGGFPVRLVVSRGLEGEGPAAVVLTVQGEGESSARYTGSLVQRPSGGTVWRAMQVTTLSTPPGLPAPAATNAAGRPVLTLSAAGSALDAQVEIGAGAPLSLALRPAATIDLIPDPMQPAREQ